MTWITTCTAPDLSKLFTPVISNYILNVILVERGGSDNPKVRAYVHLFIACTDKALRAYNTGRKLLLEYIASSNQWTVLLHGIAEFETCISTVKRCLSIAERMATHQDNPDVDRTNRKLLDSHLRTVRPVRDAIEHLDADIARGGIGPGLPHMLAVSQDGSRLEIGGYQLEFVKLASALQSIHTLALALASRER